MSNLADELKQMIIDVLALEDIRIEDIDTDAPLFGDGRVWTRLMPLN